MFNEHDETPLRYDFTQAERVILSKALDVFVADDPEQLEIATKLQERLLTRYAALCNPCE